MYPVADESPVTVIGLEVPVKVAGEVVGLGVTINDEDAPPVVDALNATEDCPLLNARDVG